MACSTAGRLGSDPENLEELGGVSNVDIGGNSTLQIKVIEVIISTFETLPTGIIHTLVELCERDDGEGKTCRGKLLQAGRDTFDVVQVVNNPICIDQVGHSFGSGRVLMSRSA